MISPFSGVGAARVLVVAWFIAAAVGPSQAAGPASTDEVRHPDPPAAATATRELDQASP